MAQYAKINSIGNTDKRPNENPMTQSVGGYARNSAIRNNTETPLAQNTGGRPENREPPPQNRGQQQSMVVHAESQEQLRSLVKQNGICVVDNYANWCGPCKVIDPQYTELANQVSGNGRCVLVKNNIDLDIPPVAGHVPPVTGVPTFHFYINGEFMNDLTVIGADIKKVEEQVKQLLSFH